MILCDYGCGQEAKYQFKNGKWCCSNHCSQCSEVRNNRSNLRREEWKDPVKRKNRIDAQKEAQLEVNKRTEVKEKKSKVQEESWKDPLKRKNRVDAQKDGQKESWKDPIKRKNRIDAQIEAWKDPEKRKNIIDAQTEAWRRLGEKENRLSKIFKACRLKPNKTETLISELVENIRPGEFKYVGDGKLWIDGKCPDWININGKKQLMEYFGNYWHDKVITGLDRKSHEKERIEHFSKKGYKTLVIWQSELKNITLLKKKILDF